jgi:hypothetical protein
MTKKQYIPPTVELFDYLPEKGYAWSQSVALHKDYVLIEGDDRSTLRAEDEVTEFTDASGEYEVGLWE